MSRVGPALTSPLPSARRPCVGWLAPLPLLVPLVALVACPAAEPCECISCDGSAVTLHVFDEAGQSFPEFVVDATVDGAVVDTSTCNDPNARFTLGSCTFGDRAGVYRVNVRASGYETRHLVARFAARSGEDCCVSPCLRGITVNAVLERAP